MNDKNCEWFLCLGTAVAHIRFGAQVLDLLAKTPASLETDLPRFHLDLCSQHLEKVWNEYVEVDAYEITECPQGCNPYLKASKRYGAMPVHVAEMG